MSDAAGGPRLVLLGSPDEGATRQVFPLREGETRIGRSSDNDVRIPDQAVSRSHCRLVRDGATVRLFDVSTRNPTRIGKAAANGRTLIDGDVIRLGRSALLFQSPQVTPQPAARRRAAGPAEARRPTRVTARTQPEPATPSPRHAPGSPPAHPSGTQRRRRSAPRAAERAQRRVTPRRTHPFTVVAAAIVVVAVSVFALVIAFKGERPVEPAADPLGSVASDTPSAADAADPSVSAPTGASSSGADATRKPAPQRAGAEELAGATAAIEADADEAPAAEIVVAAASEDDAPAVDEPAEPTPAPEATEIERPLESLTAGDARAAYFENHVVPFLAQHCISCHGEEKQEGDLTLHEVTSAEEAIRDRELWEMVAKKLRAGDMPPKTRPRPPEAELGSVIGWIDGAVFGKGSGRLDPGRVTMRRLNNREYNFTVRDLVGLDLGPADAFPADEIGYGFDNIGDILSIPPLLMEKYLATAEKIVDAVWKDEKARAAILICEPKTKSQRKSCARKVLQAFADRAFRRPATSSELSKLVKIVDLALKHDDDFELGIRLGLQAVLASPNFLFRVEIDARPDDPSAVRELNDWEIASRLSYFLWSSMPDEELLDLARSKKLTAPDVLEKQVRRMVADPKSSGLTKTFAALWLGTRSLDNVSPDPKTYPDFDDRLRRAFRKETELFFEEIMRKDLSVLLFLDADFTFLNDRLAAHYGILGVDGDEFRKVTLTDRRRGGVLTQGTVLTATSNPTRTSPVKRGKWILEQVLGAPPPPPPPGADNLAEEDQVGDATTLRQAMERHRADPNCAVCHDKMDTLGIAFESFDGIGSWREFDGKLPIDAAGTLPDGSSFKSVAELKGILLQSYKDDFCRCLTEKMLTFALGRGLEYTDTEEVERISKKLAAEEYRFSTLVLEIVRSDLFRKRRGERTNP